MNRNKVMRGDTPKWLLILVATLALGSASAGGCKRGLSWWDRDKGACVPCTRCDPAHDSVVKSPCELHRDTTCQYLHDIQWAFATSTNIRQKDKDNPSGTNDIEYYEDITDLMKVEVNSEVRESGEVEWDLQTSTLTIAASGCIVFFVVVLFLSLSHAKQWRVLKQALKSDVQELSAKLKLMESGEAAPEPTPQHHIYTNIHVAKDTLLSTASKKQGLGNVYTQEKTP